MLKIISIFYCLDWLEQEMVNSTKQLFSINIPKVTLLLDS